MNRESEIRARLGALGQEPWEEEPRPWSAHVDDKGEAPYVLDARNDVVAIDETVASAGDGKGSCIVTMGDSGYVMRVRVGDLLTGPPCRVLRAATPGDE